MDNDNDAMSAVPDCARKTLAALVVAATKDPAFRTSFVDFDFEGLAAGDEPGGRGEMRGRRKRGASCAVSGADNAHHSPRLLAPDPPLRPAPAGAARHMPGPHLEIRRRAASNTRLLSTLAWKDRAPSRRPSILLLAGEAASPCLPRLLPPRHRPRAAASPYPHPPALT